MDKIKINAMNWIGYTFFKKRKNFLSPGKKITLFGKACIINSLALSKIIYVISILSLPDHEYIRQRKISRTNFI